MPTLWQFDLADVEMIEEVKDFTNPDRWIYLCRSNVFDDLADGKDVPFYRFTWLRHDDGTIERLPVERL